MTCVRHGHADLMPCAPRRRGRHLADCRPEGANSAPISSSVLVSGGFTPASPTRYWKRHRLLRCHGHCEACQQKRTVSTPFETIAKTTFLPAFVLEPRLPRSSALMQSVTVSNFTIFSKSKSKTSVQTRAPAFSVAMAVHAFSGTAILLIVLHFSLSTTLITIPHPMLPSSFSLPSQ